MRVNCLDKNIRNFISSAALLTFLLLTIIIAFNYVYHYSTLNTYNQILLILLLLTIVVTLVYIFAVFIVIYTYKKRRIGSAFLLPAKIGLRLLLPAIIFVSGLLKADKNVVRKLYIEVNNILVELNARRYPPESILLLLPHCLQNSNCSFKITNDIMNCKSCGKCCIGDVVKLVSDTGINARVVTGGTAARYIVSKNKPEVILSVACERDLTSGIADIRDTPVIGIVNERPNGPCNNTKVDVKALRSKLESIIVDN